MNNLDFSKLFIEIEDFLKNESMQNRQVFDSIYNNPLFNDFKIQSSKDIHSKEFNLFVQFLKISWNKFNQKILDEKTKELKSFE